MSTPSAVYSNHQANKVNVTLEMLGVTSWEPDQIKPLQKKIKATADGWFGPKSLKKWKAWERKHGIPHADPPTPFVEGCVILDGQLLEAPSGVTVINHTQEGGAPADPRDTGTRKNPPIQMLLHRGTQTRRKSETYAQATERVLDSKGCSTTFTMGPDGIIHQHFDPADSYGIHCKHHNRQSDSIDIAGPFSWNIRPVEGQEKLTLKMAIGRNNDGVPPLKRKAGTVKCWTMTQAQRDALKVFLPWWCKLRGIELTACEDWRTFRIGGLGDSDPATNVKGILAHTQVAGPGSRVDGILPLHHLKEDGCNEIEWRSAEDFWN